jgi:hypothetical protein
VLSRAAPAAGRRDDLLLVLDDCLLVSDDLDLIAEEQLEAFLISEDRLLVADDRPLVCHDLQLILYRRLRHWVFLLVFWLLSVPV